MKASNVNQGEKQEIIIQVSKTVRVELGPARKKAIATKGLLSNQVTAAHYRVGQGDALNRTIKLGAEMSYIDWLSPNNTWYLYEKVGEVYELRAGFGTKEEALAAAVVIG